MLRRPLTVIEPAAARLAPPPDVVPAAKRARWAGRIALACGLINLLSALTPPLRPRLHALAEVLPGAVSAQPVTATATAAVAATGVTLLLLAEGLRNRQRRAYRASLLVLIISAAAHLSKGLDIEESLICLLAAAVLVTQSRAFVAPGRPLPGKLLRLFPEPHDPVETGRPLRWAAFAVVLTGAAVASAVLFADAAEASTAVAAAHLTGPAGALLTVAAALIARVSLRSLPAPEPASELDRQAVAALVAHPEADSLAYFSLRDDRSATFSASGKAAVTYRVISGVALVGGDPVGDPEAWPQAAQAWLAQVARAGWTPAVTAASERSARVWAKLGLEVLETGDEAVVDPRSFTLQGRAMRPVRQAAARAARAGLHVQIGSAADLTGPERDEVQAAVTAWRNTKNERGYAMALGRIARADEADVVIVRASVDGELVAVLQLVPWGLSGWSLDLMRRSPDADNGVMEAVLVAVIEHARERGLERLSLNFATFRSVLERGAALGASPAARACRSLLLTVGRGTQMERLHKFNEKFDPVWVPRYLCYTASSDLARVALAVGQAEAFLPTRTR